MTQVIAMAANVGYGITLSALAVGWVLLGVAGFIYSIICVGKTKSIWKGIWGIAVAVMMGPLFWVYHYVDKDYCRA